VEQAMILTASAMVRTGSGWRHLDVHPNSTALSPFGEYAWRLRIPGYHETQCPPAPRSYRVLVTFHARDNGGASSTRTLRFTTGRCIS
jgi:hypothetical protein